VNSVRYFRSTPTDIETGFLNSRRLAFSMSLAMLQVGWLR